MVDINREILVQSILEILTFNGKYLEPVEIAMDMEYNGKPMSAGEIRSLLENLFAKGKVLKDGDRYGDLSLGNERSPGSNSTTFSERSKLVEAGIESDRFLSDEERQEFEALKLNIRQSLFMMGGSLAIIRNKRLYRESYSSFRIFCEREFGYKYRYVYYQIASAEVIRDLKSVHNCAQNSEIENGNHCAQDEKNSDAQSCTPKSKNESMSAQNEKTKSVHNCAQNSEIESVHNCSQIKSILPTNESQTRPLIGFDANDRQKIWQRVLERTNNKQPTAKIVKEVVRKFNLERSRTKRENTYQPKFLVGNLIRVKAKGDSELKMLHNAWGQIISVEEHSYTINCWCGMKTGITRDDFVAIAGKTSEDEKAAGIVLQRINSIRLTISESNKDCDGLSENLALIGRNLNTALAVGTDVILSAIEVYLEI